MELKRIGAIAGKLLFLALLSVVGWSLVVHLLNQPVDEASPFAEPTPTAFVGFLASRAATAPHFPADHEIGTILPPTAEKPAQNTEQASVADAISPKIVTGIHAEPTATAVSAVAVEPPITTPMILGQGPFVDGDKYHKGSGLATLYSLADGSHLLRVDDLTTTSGPDLHVLLSPNIAPTDHASLGDYLDLGDLKGNIGDQNYEVAAGIDPTQYKSVVIYCLPFKVIFAIAALE